MDEDEKELKEGIEDMVMDEFIQSRYRKRELTEEEEKAEKEKKALHSFYSSANRSKREIYKLAKANEWEWFITFTFDKNKVNDRTDYDALSKRVAKYFNNWRNRKAPDLKYILIPEQHKRIEDNGLKAWHFHGLLSGTDGLNFVKLTNEEKEYYDIKTEDDVFRLEEYKLGFCTATAIKDTNRVSHYVTKYMTKSICSVLKNKRRYLNSRNLNRPMEYTYMTRIRDVEFNEGCFVDEINFADVVDISKIVYQKKKVIETPEFQNEYTYYELEDDYSSAISKSKIVTRKE